MLNPLFSTKKLHGYTKVFSSMSETMVEELKKYSDGRSFHCVDVLSVPLFAAVLGKSYVHVGVFRKLRPLGFSHRD